MCVFDCIIFHKKSKDPAIFVLKKINLKIIKGVLIYDNTLSSICLAMTNK